MKKLGKTEQTLMDELEDRGTVGLHGIRNYNAGKRLQERGLAYFLSEADEVWARTLDGYKRVTVFDGRLRRLEDGPFYR
jgi:hypothetical protein